MQPLLALSALAGLSGVALGAFGAHALRRRLEGAADGGRRAENWQTRATYHLVHALAIGLCALADERLPSDLVRAAGAAFVAGVVLFSGSLYLIAFTGRRGLGRVAPLGGLSFLVGWGCLLSAALRA